MSASPPPDWLIPSGKPWTALEERLVYQNPWISLREYQAEAPTGARTVYGVVGFRNLAVGVLPIHDDGTVILVGQHRFPAGDYSWEIPEGGVPVDADPLEGARRELKEEAGLQAADWRQVLRYQLSNSITDEHGMAYIATGLSEVPPAPDATEELAMARVPFLEALEQAMAGRIQDVITVAILLRAYHMAREGLLPEPLAKAMLERKGESR